jgi:hypothetical protein
MIEQSIQIKEEINQMKDKQNQATSSTNMNRGKRLLEYNEEIGLRQRNLRSNQ